MIKQFRVVKTDTRFMIIYKIKQNIEKLFKISITDWFKQQMSISAQ